MSYSIDNSSQILAKTVWPVARAPKDTVSITENLWNGVFFILFLSTAASRKDLSKWALCPTKIALEHSYLFFVLLIILNKSSRASISLIAFLKGWSNFILVNSRDSFSTIESWKGAIWCLIVSPGMIFPFSNSIKVIAISRMAFFFGSKPPVSISTTTGRYFLK